MTKRERHFRLAVRIDKVFVDTRKSAVRLRETANETYVLYERARAPGFHDLVLGILNRAPM
jgi:hypothetical protein